MPLWRGSRIQFPFSTRRDRPLAIVQEKRLAASECSCPSFFLSVACFTHPGRVEGVARSPSTIVFRLGSRFYHRPRQISISARCRLLVSNLPPRCASRSRPSGILLLQRCSTSSHPHCPTVLSPSATSSPSFPAGAPRWAGQPRREAAVVRDAIASPLFDRASCLIRQSSVVGFRLPVSRYGVYRRVTAPPKHRPGAACSWTRRTPCRTPLPTHPGFTCASDRVSQVPRCSSPFQHLLQSRTAAAPSAF